MTFFPQQDRMVRKEVGLGLVRQQPVDTNLIGLSQIAPLREVQSDDVIFQYATGLVTGLAPARAEDAESELAQKDDTFGTGRASVIDWALKDHYDPSDISRFREAYMLSQNGIDVSAFPLTVGSITEGFQSRQVRDTLVRRAKLDNRLEWLIWQALEFGTITYDDGKIKFFVDYQRPEEQSASVTTPWTSVDGDPIEDAFGAVDYMWDTHTVRLTRGYCSLKVIRNILNSSKFTARSGLALPGASAAESAREATKLDPRYLIDGWGVEAARAVFERATGITLIPYDALYRTRALGSTEFVNNRFFSEDKIVFLPSEADINSVDDTVGFAATLTSPHVEGNWTPGFYEWEKNTGPDPWGQDFGTGIKAFPVFPHMEYTYVLSGLLEDVV